MPIVEIILSIGIAGLTWIFVLNLTKDSQQKRQLDSAFYALLETENGEISLIQLAAAAKVDADTAHRYLEAQAKAFSASLEVDADGDTYYRFPKLHRSTNSER